MTENAALSAALNYLNSNFSPWEFDGTEDVAIELVKLLRSAGGCEQCQGQGFDSGNNGKNCGYCGRLLGVLE